MRWIKGVMTWPIHTTRNRCYARTNSKKWAGRLTMAQKLLRLELLTLDNWAEWLKHNRYDAIMYLWVKVISTSVYGVNSFCTAAITITRKRLGGDIMENTLWVQNRSRPSMTAWVWQTAFAVQLAQGVDFQHIPDNIRDNGCTTNAVLNSTKVLNPQRKFTTSHYAYHIYIHWWMVKGHQD